MSSLLGTSFNHPLIFIISANLKSPSIAPIHVILPFFIFASLLSTYSFFPLKPPDWFPKGLDPCHLCLNWPSLLVSDNLRNSLLNDCWLNEWMNLPSISLSSSFYNLPLTHVAHWFTLLLISPCMFHHCQTSFLVLSHLPTGETGGWTVFTPQNSGAKAGSCGWNSSLPLKPKWRHHQQAPRCGEPCSHSDQFLSSLRL